MTYHRHAPGEDPYVRVGEQDLTCHVDIDAVQATAVATGMRALPARSQAALLAEIGATQMPAAASGGRGAELDGYLARRRAVEVLSDPGGLGRIPGARVCAGVRRDAARAQLMAVGKGEPLPKVRWTDPRGPCRWSGCAAGGRWSWRFTWRTGPPAARHS